MIFTQYSKSFGCLVRPSANSSSVAFRKTVQCTEAMNFIYSLLGSFSHRILFVLKIYDPSGAESLKYEPFLQLFAVDIYFRCSQRFFRLFLVSNLVRHQLMPFKTFIPFRETKARNFLDGKCHLRLLIRFHFSRVSFFSSASLLEWRLFSASKRTSLDGEEKAQ